MILPITACGRGESNVVQGNRDGLVQAVVDEILRGALEEVRKPVQARPEREQKPGVLRVRAPRASTRSLCARDHFHAQS